MQGQDYRIDCVKQHTDLNHGNIIENKTKSFLFLILNEMKENLLYEDFM